MTNPNAVPSGNTDEEVVQPVGENAERDEALNEELGHAAYEAYATEEEKKRLAEIEAKLTELGGDELTGDQIKKRKEEIDQELSELGYNLEAKRAAVAEKAKRNSRFKRMLVMLLIALGLVAATAGITTSIVKNVSGTDGQQQEEFVPTGEESNDQTGEEAEAEKGIYDGYGEKGMWLSEGKAGPYNFANASEVAEVCENDECEMIKYTAHNQVESFADYLANLPEELQPDGFKGLSIIDTEAKLESLSPEEYEDVLAHFNGVMDEAFTRRVKINGTQNNAYMSRKNYGAPVVHGNMQLVKCVTNEHDLEVVEFYWQTKDGGQEIGSMRVKLIPVYDADGDIVGYEGCEQVVTPTGENEKVYDDLPEVVPDDPTPTPPGSETPPDDPTPTPPGSETPPDTSWGKTGDPHGGELVTPSDPVAPTAEVSQEQNDTTNIGNQGYVDDNKATPGSASQPSGAGESSESSDTGESGFAEIIAPDASTEEGRLTGGENQAEDSSGVSEMAGENAYQDEGSIAEGQAIDESGNAAQAEAQGSGGTDGTGITPGEDNYDDAAEEDLVAKGDF